VKELNMHVERWLATGLRSALPWGWLFTLLLLDGAKQVRGEEVAAFLKLSVESAPSFLASSLETLLGAACVGVCAPLLITSAISDLGMRGFLVPEDHKGPNGSLRPLSGRLSALNDVLRLFRLTSAPIVGLAFALSLGTAAVWVFLVPPMPQVPESLKWRVAHWALLAPVGAWLLCLMVVCARLLAYAGKRFRGRRDPVPLSALPGLVTSFALWVTAAFWATETVRGSSPGSLVSGSCLGVELVSAAATVLFVGCYKETSRPHMSEIRRLLWASD